MSVCSFLFLHIFLFCFYFQTAFSGRNLLSKKKSNFKEENNIDNDNHNNLNSKNVILLNNENFAKNVEKDIWVIKFYAPWCGHCKEYAPIFSQLADTSLNELSHVKFGEINCDESHIICANYQITAYPSTLLIHKGEMQARYLGIRQIDSIKEWIYEETKQLLGQYQNDNENDNDKNVNVQNENRNKKRKTTNVHVNNYSKKNKFPWQYNSLAEFYDSILGDTHYTIPLTIYFLGTMTGIFIGVLLVISYNF